MSDALAREVASLAKASTESVKRVEISRNFDGEYYITFPDAVPSKTISKNDVEGALKAARDELNGLSEVDAADTTLKAASLASIDNALTELGEEAQLIIGPEAVKSLRASKNTP